MCNDGKNRNQRKEEQAGSKPLKNARRERFCRNIISGKYKTDVDAFIAAGYVKKNAYKSAAKLRKIAVIVERINFLQTKAADKAISTAIERMEILTEFQRDSMISTIDRIRAIAEHNKMDGSYAPEKHDVAKKDPTEDMDEEELDRYIARQKRIKQAIESE